MTRKEWIEKNLPAYVSDKARGGVHALEIS